MNRNFPDEQRQEGHISGRGNGESLSWPEQSVWIGFEKHFEKIADDRGVMGSEYHAEEMVFYLVCARKPGTGLFFPGHFSV